MSKRKAAALQPAEEADDRLKIPSKVKRVPASGKAPSGKGFTVWRSVGYGNDGFHSYYGPPEKMFDSSWKSVKDANERAKYLFYHDNPWGLDASEILDDQTGRYDIEEKYADKCLCLRMSPPDDEIVTVGVVPDSAFEHLDNSRAPRSSNYDDAPLIGIY